MSNSKNGTKETAQATSDIPREVRAIILENELAPYRNTRWLLQQRYAVFEALNKPDEQLKAIEDELVGVQGIIAKYEELLEQIKAE